MILIADSGSTKCDWVLTDVSGTEHGTYRTMGFNPLFHSSETIAAEIQKNPDLTKVAKDITAIFFYGASNSSDRNKEIVRKGLTTAFPNAEISSNHDLMAAAYATYDGRPCISCILGTGSNSAFFDGEKTHQQVPALGYVLGDEASGAYFGKQLLATYLYKKLPAELSAELEKEYGVSKEYIIETVYTKPGANVFLAGFSPFLSKHGESPVIKEMLHNGMVHFIKEHVLCYANGREVPVHFVGSVAYHFKTALETAAAETGIQLGQVVRRPIQNMLAYHVKYIFPKLKLQE